MIGTHVNDIIGQGTGRFADESRITGRQLESKAREYDSFTFAGIKVEQTITGYLMHQEKYAKRLPQLSKD